MTTTFDVAESIGRALDGALDKLKASMDDGPEGSPAILTPEEATTLYRVLTEVYRVKHFPR